MNLQNIINNIKDIFYALKIFKGTIRDAGMKVSELDNRLNEFRKLNELKK